VVEDESDIAEVLSYNLAKEGFQVEVQPRGDAALDTLRRRPPDLVVLDLMLPGLDGLEITRTLKRDATTARIPILMLTAKGEELDRVVGLELGADDYVAKPFSPNELVARIRALVRRSRPSEPAETILKAIEKIHAGQLWLDRIATGRIFVALARKNATEDADPERRKISTLTSRERGIIAVIATNPGANAMAIAKMLHISQSTLRNHLTVIYEKLGVANRLELYAAALTHGLDKPPA